MTSQDLVSNAASWSVLLFPSPPADSVKQSGGRVLVHCQAGISRSATICLAYLMHTQRVKLDEAFDFVKRRRQVISPNLGFMGQLLQFETDVLCRGWKARTPSPASWRCRAGLGALKDTCRNVLFVMFRGKTNCVAGITRLADVAETDKRLCGTQLCVRQWVGATMSSFKLTFYIPRRGKGGYACVCMCLFMSVCYFVWLKCLIFSNSHIRNHCDQWHVFSRDNTVSVSWGNTGRVSVLQLLSYRTQTGWFLFCK